MNSRDLLQAMEGIGEEIVLKTAPAEEDTERKDKRFRRLIPFAALLSLAACLAFVWLIVRKPVAAKAESPDWDSAPLTEKELELPTADLIDVILKKDCLWQSHLQSGSGIWGPYEEWLEKLNGMRELEKRADAGREWPRSYDRRTLRLSEDRRGLQQALLLLRDSEDPRPLPFGPDGRASERSGGNGFVRGSGTHYRRAGDDRIRHGPLREENASGALEKAGAHR